MDKDDIEEIADDDDDEMSPVEVVELRLSILDVAADAARGHAALAREAIEAGDIAAALQQMHFSEGLCMVVQGRDYKELEHDPEVTGR